MSYLIALYVYTHGNNLPLFGLIPGEKAKEERNQGMKVSKQHLEDLLPEDVAEAVYKQQQNESKPKYEDILRKAIMQTQKENARLINSSIGIDMGRNVSDGEFVPDVEDYHMDLGIFDDLNDINPMGYADSNGLF